MESMTLAQPGATETVGIDIRIGLDEANALRERLCPRRQITFTEIDATRLAFPEEASTRSSLARRWSASRVRSKCSRNANGSSVQEDGLT